MPGSPTTYHTKPALSKGEWTSFLKLATQWQFKQLQKTAISALHNPFDGGRLTPMELAILAKEFDIPRWLLEGYECLINEMLSPDGQGKEWTKAEISKIGSDVAIELQRIVIGRYQATLCKALFRKVRDDIFASTSLKTEYEAMKKTAEKYMTDQQLQKAKKDEEEEKKKANSPAASTAFRGPNTAAAGTPTPCTPSSTATPPFGGSATSSVTPTWGSNPFNSTTPSWSLGSGFGGSTAPKAPAASGSFGKTASGPAPSLFKQPATSSTTSGSTSQTAAPKPASGLFGGFGWAK